MGIVTSAAERVRTLVSAKLGRCAYCIRWSGKGTILAWALVAATIFIWPHPALLGVTLLVAGAFSLLLLAHVSTLSVRLASRHADREASSGRPLDRRAFLQTCMSAAGGALLFALTGSAPAFAVPAFCGDFFLPGRASVEGADTLGDCWKRLYEIANCAARCEALTCADAATPYCKAHGPAVILFRKQGFDGAFWHCSGELGCNCGCGHKPGSTPPPEI